MTETVCQYRSTCLHFLLKQTSKTHSAQQAQAQWAHIDRRASVDR